MDDDANGDVDVEESDEVSSLTMRASLLFLCKQSLKLSRQAVPWGEVFLLLACSLASHPYQGRWFSAEQPRGAGLTSLSVSGPAPVCLPAGSTMLTELCCLRGRGSPEAGLYSLPASLLYSCWSWRAPICPDSVFNPVLACGGEGKAVRSCPLETYTVCEEETEVPRKVVLNSRLQPLEVSWVVHVKYRRKRMHSYRLFSGRIWFKSLVSKDPVYLHLLIKDSAVNKDCFCHFLIHHRFSSGDEKKMEIHSNW